MRGLAAFFLFSLLGLIQSSAEIITVTPGGGGGSGSASGCAASGDILYSSGSPGVVTCSASSLITTNGPKILTTPTYDLKTIYGGVGNNPGEMFTIESTTPAGQTGNSGTHFYQGAQAFDLEKGTHYDNGLQASVWDDPTIANQQTSFMEYGEGGIYTWIGRTDSGSVPHTVTLSIANPAVLTITGNLLAANQALYITTTGALPSHITATAGNLWPTHGGAWDGANAATLYYVKTVLDANTFTISATPGGAAISTLGDTQSGTHTLTAAANLTLAQWINQANSDPNSKQIWEHSPVYFDSIIGGVLAQWQTPTGTIYGNVPVSTGALNWYGTFQSVSTLPVTASVNIAGALNIGGLAAPTGGQINIYSGATGNTFIGGFAPHSTYFGSGVNYNPLFWANTGLGFEIYVNGNGGSPSLLVDSAGNTTLTGGLISAGGALTGNTGTCSTNVTVTGGHLAGTWTSSSNPACAAAGTIILSAMPAATTGYSCHAEDRTLITSVLTQTATSTTSATFTVGAAAIAQNNIVQFFCMGY